MGFFDAFYFMSYTASTIGFGELPVPVHLAQRLWVTVAIYLTVIGWAYAIGSLLALLQDRAFRQALALQQFTPQGVPAARAVPADRRVRAHRGAARPLVRRARAGASSSSTIERADRRAWTSTPTTPTCPAWSATPATRAPRRRRAGPPVLRGGARAHRRRRGEPGGHHDRGAAAPRAAGGRARSLPAVAERMRAFGAPTVVNPFDRFGDHLRLALRAPASYQLMTWLESGPGAELPAARPAAARRPLGGLRLRPARPGADRGPARRGSGGHGRRARPADRRTTAAVVVGDGSDPAVLAAGGPRRRRRASSPARTTTRRNLSLVAAARRANPDLFVAARQNRAGQRAAVRRDGDRRPAGAHRGRRARGVRAAQHPAAVAVPAGDAGQGDAWAAGSSTG